MSTQRMSLRQGVWTGDAANPREVGEALRDIFGYLSRARIVDVVEVNSAVWAEPFSIAVAGRPKIASLMDARLAGTLEAVAATSGEWRGDGITRVTFTGIQGLNSGTSYDLKFLVVY